MTPQKIYLTPTGSIISEYDFGFLSYYQQAQCKVYTATEYEPVKYGDYVQMDDRFETVHIWSKEMEEKNAGRWVPTKITKQQYESVLSEQVKRYKETFDFWNPK